MATWQLGGLPSMAPQNDNAPRSSVPQPVQYQQQPNVGLMALQGLRGVAEINQQARQQQRKAEFQKAYAGAFESGDRNKMRSLISEYPEEFESVQKGMGFIDDDQRNSIGHLATSAQIASSLGTGAFGKFIADNEDEMRRLGISPESVAEMHVNDPDRDSSGLLVVWHCFLSVMRSTSISKIEWKAVDLSKGDWMKVCVRLTWRTREDGQISRTLN